jgi:hypothetical protein
MIYFMSLFCFAARSAYFADFRIGCGVLRIAGGQAGDRPTRRQPGFIRPKPHLGKSLFFTQLIRMGLSNPVGRIFDAASIKTGAALASQPFWKAFVAYFPDLQTADDLAKD